MPLPATAVRVVVKNALNRERAGHEARERVVGRRERSGGDGDRITANRVVCVAVVLKLSFGTGHHRRCVAVDESSDRVSQGGVGLALDVRQVIRRDGERAGLTVKLPLALLDPSVESPAKLAPTAPVNVPASRPVKLTPVNVATPLALVVAIPTGVGVPPSFTVNKMVLPDRGEPLEVKVAVRVAVAP